MRYLLGRVYQQLGRKEDALREFNESKRLREAQLEKDREKTANPNQNHEDLQDLKRMFTHCF